MKTLEMALQQKAKLQAMMHHLACVAGFWQEQKISCLGVESIILVSEYFHNTISEPVCLNQAGDDQSSSMCNLLTYAFLLMTFTTNYHIASVWHGDAVASPTLKN